MKINKREVGKQIYDIAIEFKTKNDEGFTADEVCALMELLENKVKDFDSQHFFNCHLSANYHEVETYGYSMVSDRTDILRCAVNAIKEPKKTKTKKKK